MLQASSFSTFYMHFVKIMYFECQNKQFEEEKNKVRLRRVGGKIIIKRIKSILFSSCEYQLWLAGL